MSKLYVVTFHSLFISNFKMSFLNEYIYLFNGSLSLITNDGFSTGPENTSKNILVDFE